MRPESCSKSRKSIIRSYIAISVFLAAAFCSCDSSRLISGVYRSETAVVIDGIPGFENGLWMELVLGQFGPDLTGIVRVYQEEGFLVPAAGMCPCRFVDNGEVVDSRVGFVFRNPADCPGSTDSLFVVATLNFDEPGALIDDESGEYLSGELVLQDALTSGAVPEEVSFRRVLSWGRMGEDDMSCNDPLVRTGTDSFSPADGVAE